MIREVQLTNFMSYTNAKVPLEPGLNLVIGPNGAGKSSILLAISVVLGQTYTERAKKLSDLIRWGEEEARVSIILDNEGLKGVRPFPRARGGTVVLTRILKKSGDYGYLLNNKPVSKLDVMEGLSGIGLNPDNMLVIMHQLMVGRFGSVTPAEKLLMLEDAVGFASYRKEVLESSEKLQKLTTERQAMASVLEGTRETYEHWRREYEKWETKKKLEHHLRELQREMVWRKIIRKESAQKRIEDRVSRVRNDLEDSQKQYENSERTNEETRLQLVQLNKELDKRRDEQLELEHQRGYKEGLEKWIIQVKELLASVERSEEPSERTVASTGGPTMQSILHNKIKKSLDSVIAEIEQLKGDDASRNQQKEHAELVGLTGQIAKGLDLLVESRVNREVNRYKISIMEDQIREFETQLRLGKEELEPLMLEANQLGTRFDEPRELHFVASDVKIAEDRLRPLAHLSEEVEKMYHNYAGLYDDLRKKADVVELNRAEVLRDLHQRLEKWQGIMEKLFEDLSIRYNNLLSKVEAKGRITLKPSKDIEKSGLELYAGFKGNDPVSLDSLAPSGGERTVAIIAFLLSLQQHVESPFRAIDEFDVHMDPKNRETVTRLIYAAAKTDKDEYIAITPGEVALPEEKDVHVVVVQNVEGTSVIKELR